MIVFVEEAFLEDQDGDDTDRDRSVGEVEDWAEEFEFIAADKGEPRRIVRFDDREIEHVHYAAVQEGSIAMRRKDFGDVLVRTSFEDEAIEHTIDQVAEGAGEDEAGTDDKAPVIFLFDNRLDIVDAEDDGDKTEKSEGYLTYGAAEFPTPCHAFVLDEIDLGFVAQEFDSIVIRRDGVAEKVGRMAQRHMSLYPDFQRLICYDDQQHY